MIEWAIKLVGLLFGTWLNRKADTAKDAGRSEAHAATAQKNVQVQQEMRDANAAGPRTASDVDKRLLDGKF